MMDARMVWNTWRRVLTSDQLVAWVTDPDSRAEIPDGLTADELAILTDYASTPVATDSNIGMYRRGIIRNALGALDLVPLTRRLLHASGLDMDTVANDFARKEGYADHGPYFWRAAAGFVAYVAGLPQFASRAQQDVLALDAATIALARQLGESAAAVWPDSAAAAMSTTVSQADRESTRFIANSAAVVVSSNCDLTPWIENPFAFDPDEAVEAAPRHWLIYFPTADATHEYAELSERSARAFRFLGIPKSPAELSQALNGLSRADVLTVIDSLAGLGVVASESVMLGETAEGRRLLPPRNVDQYADDPCPPSNGPIVAASR